jgi:hypothetical protein
MMPKLQMQFSSLIFLCAVDGAVSLLVFFLVGWRGNSSEFLHGNRIFPFTSKYFTTFSIKTVIFYMLAVECRDELVNHHVFA